MKTLPTSCPSLYHVLGAADDLRGLFVFGPETNIAFSDLVAGSALYGRGDEMYGKSVLITTKDQLSAAWSLMELDGIAARIVLCPPDLLSGHLPYLVAAANVDAIVSDHANFGPNLSRVRYLMPCTRKIVPQNYSRSEPLQTEWILLTSGTTGRPKLVVHTLSSLAGAIEPDDTGRTVVWSTFYDIRRYGGLQIFLRSILTGKSLVLTSSPEPTEDFLSRAGSHEVTHISGTPSQWRCALMGPSARRIDPEYVRLSGEIADQAVINRLHSIYPRARIAHAFASTEAGVAFDVSDGLAGFPESVLHHTPNVGMTVAGGTLRVRSNRTAQCYLGDDAPALKGLDGFVDTCDLVELRGERYHFVGRRDGLINVGGLKVYPEEIETVINRHPAVHMALVRAQKNSVTGSIVVADVVLKALQPESSDLAASQNDILRLCREALSSHKVPAAINFVSHLPVNESGKMMRDHA